MSPMLASIRAGSALVLTGAALAGCVPEGASTADAGAAAKPFVNQPVPGATARPMGVRAHDAGESSSSGPVVAQVAGEAGAPVVEGPHITSVFEDKFDRTELGPDWNTLTPNWKIQGGKLCVRGAHNRGAWLARRLPVNARIEFEAFAESAEGDVKVELWGDGVSGATARSYTNATSYIAILGGWKNTKNVFARINEHGEGRLEIDLDPQSDDEKARPLAVGQAYHFKVERSDGKRIECSVNGSVYFTYADTEPLAGAGHEHFGFNDWEAPVCFDNLKVTPL
jgi:hypothetical protein